MYSPKIVKKSLLIFPRLALVLTLCGVGSLHAASSSWTGAIDGDFTNGGNWSAGTPGVNPAAANTDVATFAVNTNTFITVDANRTLGSVLFDTGAGAFRFTGGPLLLNSSAVTINAGVTQSQTFEIDIRPNGLGSGPAFLNSSTTAGTIFNISGNLSARALGGTVGFTGVGTGHIVRANISDGGAGPTAINRDSNSQILMLKGNNSYTGVTTMARGAVYFDSLAVVGGGNSSFGAATLANSTFNIGSTGGYEFSMIYTGSGHTTDRAINFVNNMGVNLNAAGTGALIWDGNMGTSHASTHSVTLSGFSTAENRFGGILSNSTNAGQASSLTKGGSSTWNLTGANTYTGNTNVGEGLLRLDFSNASAPSTDIVNSGSALVMEGGTLALRGKTTGISSQTVNNFTLNAGHSKILADGNGGTSTTLNLGTITRSGVGAVLDVSLASTGAVTTFTSTVTNGVISNNGVAYATVNGSDWATYNAGNIQALTTYQTDANPGTWAATDNVSLAGNPSATVGTQSVNTLRITAASTVTVGGADILTVDTGGILLTGTGNTLITGGTLRGSGGTTKELIVIQNKTSGTAEINSTIANNAAATAFTKAGEGTLTLSGTNTYTGTTTVSGGVLRIAPGSNYGGGLVLSGGVLGLANGDFSAILGVNAAGRVSWTNSGGFAAYGADRTVTITSATPTWGSTANFLGAHDALILGANDADAKIIWASNFNLQTGSSTLAQREIRVHNGSAAVDAEISGVIGVIAGNHGGFVKTGTGTLLLSAVNTYDGPTFVSAGTLIVNGSIANSMLTTVNSGATLRGSGTTAQIEIMAGASIAPGASAGAIGMLSTSQNGNSDLVWNGETSGSFGQMKFELSASSNASDLLELGVGKFDQGSGLIFAFDFLGTGGAGYTYTLVNFGLTDFTVDDFSYVGLASGLTGFFTLNSDSLQFTTSAIPEPSTYAMMLGGLGLLAWLRLRKQA